MVQKCKAVLLDLEGTLYFKGALIPGAAHAIADLRQSGLVLRFLTNTDSLATESICNKVGLMGLDITPDEVFTPVTALTQFLANKPAQHCHFLLSREIRAVLGPRAVDATDLADYVVVGDCRESVNYEELNKAFRHLMAGAQLLALQKGRYFIRTDGINLDTGAFVALLEYASGKVAQVLGKPSPAFFEMALDHAGFHADEAAIVGDDLTTDITGAKNVGALAVLVRTGKYDAEQIARSPMKPDVVADSIADVPQMLLAMSQELT